MKGGASNAATNNDRKVDTVADEAVAVASGRGRGGLSMSKFGIMAMDFSSAMGEKVNPLLGAVGIY